MIDYDDDDIISYNLKTTGQILLQFYVVNGNVS